MAFFDKLKAGLAKTKEAVFGRVDDLFRSFVKVDEEFLEELEEILICADMGATIAMDVVDELRDQMKENRVDDPEEVKGLLKTILRSKVGDGEELKLDTDPSVILVIGVNGVGKTTSIGKIAAKLVAQGKKVVVAAASGRLLQSLSRLISGKYQEQDKKLRKTMDRKQRREIQEKKQAMGLRD